METFSHNMKSLFDQLGLPSSEREIQRFITRHALHSSKVKLPDATFWNDSQAAFLKEAIDNDSDWSELVDELDTLLRQH